MDMWWMPSWNGNSTRRSCAVKSHRYHHDGELTPFACRSSTISLLPKVTLGWQPAWYFRLREVKSELSMPCRGPNPWQQIPWEVVPNIYPTQVVTRFATTDKTSDTTPYRRVDFRRRTLPLPQGLRRSAGYNHSLLFGTLAHQYTPWASSLPWTLTTHNNSHERGRWVPVPLCQFQRSWERLRVVSRQRSPGRWGECPANG
jgi:hypothetical protein